VSVVTSGLLWILGPLSVRSQELYNKVLGSDQLDTELLYFKIRIL